MPAESGHSSFLYEHIPRHGSAPLVSLPFLTHHLRPQGLSVPETAHPALPLGLCHAVPCAHNTLYLATSLSPGSWNIPAPREVFLDNTRYDSFSISFSIAAPFFINTICNFFQVYDQFSPTRLWALWGQRPYVFIPLLVVAKNYWMKEEIMNKRINDCEINMGTVALCISILQTNTVFSLKVSMIKNSYNSFKKSNKPI